MRYNIKAGCLPQHWNFLLTQAKVEEVLENPTWLFCTGLQDPGAAALFWLSLSCCFFT